MNTDMPEMSRQEPDHGADVTAMVEEISMALATGLVPFVGQAINVYDTVQSFFTLHNSKSDSDRLEAKFDLVLALIGWIPGAGSGVKKSIRIVNKHPERYAPILFDVLRLVCVKLGIQTSPEVLLDKLFNATGLKAQLTTVQSVIEGSWLYKEMPSEGQTVVSSSMTMVRTEIAAMVLIATTKLLHWKKMQRNTAARATVIKKTPKDVKPAKHDPNVASLGHDTPSHAPANGTLNAETAIEEVQRFTNSITGIIGEHITDYFLYEEYKWGGKWTSQDQGSDGKWENNPGREFSGKLNEEHKLNRLFALKAHGTGIDGAWKVNKNSLHNDGKPYAIVESKASQVASKQKNPSKKPSILSKLLDNARRIEKAALPKIEELLEPDLTDNASVGPQSSEKKTTPVAKKSSKNQPKPKQATLSGSSSHVNSIATPATKEVPVVQMSQRWIENNIRRAIRDHFIVDDILVHGTSRYSRHLFYTPAYLPNVELHLDALRHSASEKHEEHTAHGIPLTHRHGEREVKEAVNHKLEKLGLTLEP